MQETKVYVETISRAYPFVGQYIQDLAQISPRGQQRSRNKLSGYKTQKGLELLILFNNITHIDHDWNETKKNKLWAGYEKVIYMCSL